MRRGEPSVALLTTRIVWRVALFFLVFGSIGALFFVPFSSVATDWAQVFPVRTQLLSDLAGALAMLAATWTMTRFVDRRSLRTVGFSSEHALRDVGIGLAAGAGWIALSLGPVWAAGWASFVRLESFSGGLLLVAATSVLLNVLTQQLLLCGYVFQTIRTHANSRAAVLISAVLFSAYHGGAFQGAWIPAVNVFAAGLLFCLAYDATGNLWLPLAIHFTWNLLLGPVLGLTVSGSIELGLGWRLLEIAGPARWTGGSFGVEGGLVVTLTTALAISVVVGLRRFRGGRSHHPG